MNKKQYVLLTGTALLAAALVFGYFFFVHGDEEQVEDEQEQQEELEDMQVLAEDLEVPWDLVFLPDGDMLFTKRGYGTVHIMDGETFEIEEVFSVDITDDTFEGGLLGVTLHPDFEENRYIYFYATVDATGGGIENRVKRYVFDGNNFSEKTIIVDGIPAAQTHNGGRIKFGPDNHLYITTGDAELHDRIETTGTHIGVGGSQDVNNLAGKILRVNDDGSVPEDNPFGNEVWSYGHRNPQGIAWDSEDRLWATEHGGKANDELNLIEPGNNYGWPVIEGMEEYEGMETPAAYSGSDYTWAPSGMTIIDDVIYFAGLRGSAIYEVDLSNSVEDLEVETNLKHEFALEEDHLDGRIRFIRNRDDGYVYIATSEGHRVDRLIRINLELLR